MTLGYCKVCRAVGGVVICQLNICFAPTSTRGGRSATALRRRNQRDGRGGVSRGGRRSRSVGGARLRSALIESSAAWRYRPLMPCGDVRQPTRRSIVGTSWPMRAGLPPCAASPNLDRNSSRGGGDGVAGGAVRTRLRGRDDNPAQRFTTWRSLRALQWRPSAENSARLSNPYLFGHVHGTMRC